MYYDVVVSVYDKNGIELYSEAICGGFKTKDEAMRYADNLEINEYTYTYSDDEYAYIEVNEYNKEGMPVRFYRRIKDE